MYITPIEYASLGYSSIPENERIKALQKACTHIDTLTFNRIRGKGFNNLTEFQQQTLREVICEQAEFEYDNEDMINSIISSYSLNGASVSFGGNWNVHIENGIAMKKDTYGMLKQTGLCSRLVGV